MDPTVKIGVMRASGGPTFSAVALAHAAAVQRADLVFFNPPDVDLEADLLRGWVYDGDRWQHVETRLPDVVVNDLSSIRHRRIWQALQERLPFTSPLLGDKVQILRRMKKGGFYPRMQIPTETLSSLQSLLDLLDRHDRVVVKPRDASQGKDVFFLAKAGASYQANLGSSWVEFSPAELAAFFANNLENNGFIGQKYIEAKTKVGLPFDIRIHARRGEGGRWKTLSVYPRIGSGRDITANFSSGGSIADLRSFLTEQFGASGADVRDELLHLAQEMPPRFQNLYEDRIVDAVGIDVGLDPAGRPWLFEVNPFPWTKFFELKAAIPRVRYAVHLARSARRRQAALAPGEKMDPRPVPEWLHDLHSSDTQAPSEYPMPLL